MLPVGNRSGIPCGPFYQSDGIAVSQWYPEFPYWTGGQAPLFVGTALTRLATMRSNGLSMFLGLQGNSSLYRTGGYFDFTKWKNQCDAMYALGIESYIEDGTVYANYMIDEPKAINSWGGVTVPNNTLDDMAAYSKTRWPTLPCLVRDEPLILINRATVAGGAWPGGAYEWQHLDGAWCQYNTTKGILWGGGVVSSYMANNYASAQSQGLSLVCGYNWRDGGDGTSGVQAWPIAGKSTWWCMSPTEVSTYMLTLLSDQYPDVSGFCMWKHVDNTIEEDVDDYWDSAPMRTAFDTLLARCAERERRPLLKRL